MIEPKYIKTSKLSANIGQIEGLPKNPRQWDEDDVERLAQSIVETPELAEARPAIVIKNGNKYVVLGGNLRLSAYRKNGMDEMPCIEVPQDTPIDKLKQIVMKDNSSFGDWDVDELANQWDSFDLASWGVNISGLEGSTYDGSNTEINTDDWKEDMTLKFHLAEEQYNFVVAKLGADPKKTLLNALGYED